MKKSAASILLVVFLSLFWGSCHSSDGAQKGLVYANDFEDVKGWIHGLGLCTYPVHSGSWACRMDTLHPYGPTVHLRFDEISTQPLKKVSYSIWCFLKTPNTQGKMIVAIDGGGKQNILYEAKDIRETIKETGKWVEFKGECDLSKGGFNRPDNSISVYPWNTSKGEMIVDDMQVTFIQ
jgi:hypothetical protein